MRRLFTAAVLSTSLLSGLPAIAGDAPATTTTKKAPAKPKADKAKAEKDKAKTKSDKADKKVEAAVTAADAAKEAEIAAQAKEAEAAKVAAAAEAAAAAAAAAEAPVVDATAPVAVGTPAKVDATPAVADTAAVAAVAPETPTIADPGPAPSAPVSADERLVAVLDLKPSEGATAQASALTAMLTAEISAQKGFRAVSRNELQALLTHQATAQLVGCDEPRCAADVAHLANADFVVTGAVEKLEGATVVSLTLMNAGGDDGASITGRQKAAWRGDDTELLLVMRPLVQRLFDSSNAHTHIGNVEVFVPEGAMLVLDDKEVGTAPVSALRDLSTGVHQLKLLKDGYSPETVDLVVSRNETTIVRVDMEPIPLTDQPWFWAAAGGAAVAGGLGQERVAHASATTGANRGPPTPGCDPDLHLRSLGSSKFFLCSPTYADASVIVPMKA